MSGPSPPSPPPRRWVPPQSGTARNRMRRLRGVALLLLATMIAMGGGLLALRLGARRVRGAAVVESVPVPGDPKGIETMLASLEKEVKSLESQNRRLQEKIARYRPRGIYLVIDTGANRLYVMKDEKVLREAVCSTGSGVRLADPNTPRSWIFDTPRGELSVRGKTTDPIWVKPDWAFIETGERIPRGLDDRMEEGVLGDYALDLGQGYLIHGTLFERALGLHVTHGCVRMGAKDLEYLFKTVQPGTKVYIV